MTRPEIQKTPDGHSEFFWSKMKLGAVIIGRDMCGRGKIAQSRGAAGWLQMSLRITGLDCKLLNQQWLSKSAKLGLQPGSEGARFDQTEIKLLRTPPGQIRRKMNPSERQFDII
jgi:hypothetical protein